MGKKIWGGSLGGGGSAQGETTEQLRKVPGTHDRKREKRHVKWERGKLIAIPDRNKQGGNHDFNDDPQNEKGGKPEHGSENVLGIRKDEKRWRERSGENSRGDLRKKGTKKNQKRFKVVYVAKVAFQKDLFGARDGSSQTSRSN